MPTYASVLTEIGQAQLINSQVTGQSLTWSKMAVGDGNGAEITPSSTATALAHEVYRSNISSLRVDPEDSAQIIADMIILPEIGGWTIREVGIFDSDDRLVVYGSLPATVKPILTEGSGITLTIRCRAAVGNDANITLEIDPSQTIASREYVEATTIKTLRAEGKNIIYERGNGATYTETITLPDLWDGGSSSALNA